MISAANLYVTGRAHALAAQGLHRVALDFAHENALADPDHCAFNGTYSLSIFYLIGLGLELLLKAAYVHHGGSAFASDYRP